MELKSPLLLNQTADVGGEKVVICHVPPGNPDNAHTASVSVNALEAHLAHGDYEGECLGQDSEGGEDEGEDEGEKVVICHVPPGNPGNAHTITVGADALDAHLAHGDYEGECEEDGGAGEEEEEEEEEEDDGEDEGEKVVICHIPPGNPGNARTKSVSANALEAHLAHGDTIGACPDDESG